MDNTLKYALREAAGIAGDTARFYAGALALPVIVPVAVAGVAALSAAALGSWIAGADGRVILSELRRRARLRAPHAPSPSLRGRPTPEEVGATAPDGWPAAEGADGWPAAEGRPAAPRKGNYIYRI